MISPTMSASSSLPLSEKSAGAPTEAPARPWTRHLKTLALVLLLAKLLFTVHASQSIPQSISLEERVNRILSHTPLIDGHDDLPILIRAVYQNRIYDENFTTPFEKGGFSHHVDLPRLSAGKVGGTFWSVFVECPRNWSDFSSANYATSVRQAIEQVDLMTRLQQAYPETFSLPPNGTTALQAFRDGKIISPMGIEGLHSIGNSLAYLRHFHARGVAYATLTHNCHNRYADAAVVTTASGDSMKAPPLWHGVSEAGKELIFEMNRLGMIVDLAHVSADTMRDVLGSGKDDWSGSRAPPIFSHSSAYGLCPHPRNVPDDVLELVRQRNSIVMVNFSPDFIACTASDDPSGIPDLDPSQSTISRVVDHILYIGDRIGFDHVGLGSDFDGVPTTPQGLEDVSRFPDLVAEMLRRGVSDEDAAKVVGGNLLRVWREVDEVAIQMRAEGALPVEDDVE